MAAKSTLSAAFALLIAAPATAADLTIYTYDSFVSEWGPGPALETLFEARCGCDVEFLAAGDGAALLGRVQLEGANARADVVLGLDANLVAAARETGLFAAHGAALPEAQVPGGWDDPIFVPYDWGHFAFVYDETRLAEPPTSFGALLDAPDDLTIIIQDPRTSTPGLGLLLWVEKIYGDRAGEVWEALEPRIVTVTKGWWEAYSAFLEGEAAMALSYTTSPAYHVVAEEDSSKKAAMFEEGHYLQVEVAAALGSSENPALASDFLAFLASPEAQDVLPTTNWMRPAFPTAEPLPDAFDAFQPETSLAFAVEDAPGARAAALERWLEALSR
ncbi:MAG: thiamine ABC transporter substrate binding subunit [Pseudomonadota bacterium]